MTNSLTNSSSPYLLQHAHNPVDWYPWGEEALAKAKAERLFLKYTDLTDNTEKHRFLKDFSVKSV